MPLLLKLGKLAMYLLLPLLQPNQLPLPLHHE